MSAATVFARKEATEAARSWRGPLLVGLFALFGVVDPIMARYLREIMTALAPGFPVPLPEATYLTSWGQWVKDLNQLLLIVVVVAHGGLVANETRSGTAVLVLARPLSRPAFILSKFVVASGVLAVAGAVGTGLAWTTTWALYGATPGGGLFVAASLWWVQAVLLLAVVMLVSSCVDSPLVAAMVGIAALMALGLAGSWSEPARAWTPAGLPSAMADALTGAPAWAWPVGTAAAITVLLVASAIVVFNRREP